MGVPFVDCGVKVKLSNPYFPSNYMQQVRALAQHAGIQFLFDNGVLAITPPGTPLPGGSVTVSPSSGLIGYQSVLRYGVAFRCMFNPNLKMLGAVQLQSSIRPANGSWIIQKLVHLLDAETTQGRWFSIVEAKNTAGGAAVPPDET